MLVVWWLVLGPGCGSCGHIDMNLWKHTFCSLWVWCAGGLLFGASVLSSRAVDLVNGSSSNFLYVVSSVGRATVAPGVSLSWECEAGQTATNGVVGGSSSTWLVQSGHDYQVYLPETGGPVVVDRSPAKTAWFWWGFALVFCAGLVGYMGRWSAGIISGGYNE